MFASLLAQQSSSLTLPNPLFGSSAFGQDPSTNCPTNPFDRSQWELNYSRLLSDRLISSLPPGAAALSFSVRPEAHRSHQHLHQRPMPPTPGVTAADGSIPSGATVGPTGPPSSLQLLDMVGYSGPPGASGSRSSSSQTLSLSGGGPLGLPLTSVVSGAFHPKNDGSNLNSVPHLLLPVQETLAATQQQGRLKLKKSGHWCAAHVRIAWEIHLGQRHQKHEQTEVQRLCTSTNTAEIDQGEISVNGHLDPLYRLGVPLFGRLPFSSSSRIQLNNFPFGGSLGGVMHRLTASHETPGDESGFAGDWLMRLGKSSSLYSAPPPPPFWLSSEAEKKREEDGRTRQNSQESNERLRERNGDSRRSSGSSSSCRNERPRSRSPVKLHRNRLSLSHDNNGGSPSHRAYSSSSSSSSTSTSCSTRRRTQRGRTLHVPRESDFPVASGRNDDDDDDDPSPPSSRLFPGGMHHTPPRPGASNNNTLLATTDQVFLQRPPPSFLWSDPFRMSDGDQLRRMLGGAGESDDPDGALVRLAHLDLMLRKSLVPAGLGGLPFRQLSSSPGFPGKAGFHSYFGMLPISRQRLL